MKNWHENYRQTTITVIRETVRVMVGNCNDYQIIFCAVAVHRISQLRPTLDELSEYDLESLYTWIVEESQ